MTRALLVVSSKGGATRGIAQKIEAALKEAGVHAELHGAAGAPAPDGFDAVILVNAVYAGRWLSDARAYAKRHADALRARPLWIASSGPVGFPLPESADSQSHARDLNARDHTVFAGAIDPRASGLIGRAVLRMMKRPGGDFRDWKAIATWAQRVAREIEAIAHAAA